MKKDIYRYSNYIMEFDETWSYYDYIDPGFKNYCNSNGKGQGTLDRRQINTATQEEKDWLRACQKIGRFIPKEDSIPIIYSVGTKAGFVDVAELAPGERTLAFKGGIVDIMSYIKDTLPVKPKDPRRYVKGVNTFGDLKRFVNEKWKCDVQKS